MQKDPRNTWSARLRRTLTAFLPVARNRNGKCRHCGACCHLPNRCWFLHKNGDGTFRCLIYPIRPMNCRKYPRTRSEFITKKTCGYRFE